MTILTTPQIICDIICKSIKFPTDQIWIYNQRTSIPEDKKLYCVVGLVSSNPYSNTKRQSTTTDEMNDSLTTLVVETIQIDLLSYTTEAIEKYAMFLAAMRTTYSQQMQEKYALKISEIPMSVNDVSSAEGAALLYRMAITLKVFRKYDTIIDAEFYDKFNIEILTENEGMIEV